MSKGKSETINIFLHTFGDLSNQLKIVYKTYFAVSNVEH